MRSLPTGRRIRKKVAAFHTTRTLGADTKVLLDEDAGKFMVTRARNLAEANRTFWTLPT